MSKPILKLLALAAALAVGLPYQPALAAPADSGNDPTSIPQIRDGYGSVEIPSDSTTANGQDGTPGSCGTAQGAGAYSITTDASSRISLTVTELQADGICAIGLYRLRSGGDQLGSLYDPDQRASFAHIEMNCAASCRINRRVGSNTHLFVVWPSGTGAVERGFSIDGSIQRVTTIEGDTDGVRVGTCRRVDKGSAAALSVAVSPAPGPTDAKVEVQRSLRGGATEDLGDLSLDSQGEATLDLSTGRRGLFDLTIRFPGSPTQEPRRIKLCLFVRGPSKVGIEPKRWRYQYDDYSVYRHGDTMIFRFPVGPGATARGRIDIRIIRNIGNHRYKPFAVKRGIPVSDGLAVVRIKAKYRSDGLPFYRIRGEWRGSHTHAPARSRYICYQINR